MCSYATSEMHINQRPDYMQLLVAYIRNQTRRREKQSHTRRAYLPLLPMSREENGYHLPVKTLIYMVGVTGFEPATSTSQT